MLHALTPDLHVSHHPLSVAGLKLGTRMTVVRLDGGLALISPTPIDDALAASLSELGEVRWIVAPNQFHHLFLAAAAERYPDAQVLAAPGLTDKVPALEGAVQATLDPDALPWGEALTAHPVAGMPKLNEVVFLHRPSRSLIVTDVMFNITRPSGLWSRMMLKLMGASGGPRQSRLLRSMVKDAEAFQASILALLELDFDRVVLCHGEIVESGGPAALRAAASWNLPEAARAAA